MADEQLIKPRELPAATAVFADDAIMTDDGVTVAKATPVQIVDAGAPVASQAEAIAGTDNTKRMTPLTTKQVLDNVSAPAVLRAQAWAESATTPDPLMPGSKSSRTWALEAAQSASDAATSEENAAISAGQAVAAMAGSVRFDAAQTLTSGQKQQARDNIAALAYDAQTLTPANKSQVLSNFGWMSVKTTAGYEILPSGLILQWGRVGSWGSEGAANVTFPIAFPTACIIVQATAISDWGGANQLRSVYVHRDFSLTGLEMFLRTQTGTGGVGPVTTTGGSVHWFAIGH